MAGFDSGNDTLDAANGRPHDSLIDCPTSRVSVVAASIDHAKTVWQGAGSPTKFRVLVCCLNGFDLLAKVQEKLEATFVDWRVLVVQ